MRWAQPMKQLFRSKAATGMGMGGAITAVAATTMVGGIIAIGGEQTERARLHRLTAS